MRSASSIIPLLLILTSIGTVHPAENPIPRQWRGTVLEDGSVRLPPPVVTHHQGIERPGSGELDMEGPYLVVSSVHSQDNIVATSLRGLGVDFDYVYDWYCRVEEQELSEYGTVILAMNSGYCYLASWSEMEDFCESGGNVIIMGGTYSYYPDWSSGMRRFWDGRAGQWTSTTPGLNIIDEDHLLTRDLPDDYAFQRDIRQYYWRVDEEDEPNAQVAARNGDGYPSLVTRMMDFGTTIYVAFSICSRYYDGRDEEVMEDIWANILNFEIGSKMYGTVINRRTGDPVDSAFVEVFHLEADSTWYSLYTDSTGGYLIPYRLLPEFTYSTVVSKYYYVDYVIDTVDFEVPDDAVYDINLDPYLDTNIEAVQTEVAENDWVDITGIVTQPTNSTTTEHTSFYLQDHTIYGVNIWEETPWDTTDRPNLNRGDSVRVIGRVIDRDGVTAVTDLFLWEVISSGHEIPFTMEMPTGSIARLQELEGTWCTIAGYLQQDPGEGDFLVQLDDESGPVWMHVLEETGIDAMEGFGTGDWFHAEGVISIYNGQIRVVPSLPQDVWRTPILAPVNLFGIYDDTTHQVILNWAHPAVWPFIEIAYDDGEPTAGNYPRGREFAVRFTPEGPCRLIYMKYYVLAGDEGWFDAILYDWPEGADRPGFEEFRMDSVIVEEGHQDWYEIGVFDQRIHLQHDFVLSFTGDDNGVRQAMDLVVNEQSWLKSNGRWSHAPESYLIRAVVQYADGEIAEIAGSSGELDDFIEFNVYRNDSLLTTVNVQEYEETLPGEGRYVYNVTSLYYEGESEYSAPFVAAWGDVGAEENRSAALPGEFVIDAVYPNPFNSSARVRVALPDAAELKLWVTDILGREVTRFSRRHFQPGFHEFTLDGGGISSGIYFIHAVIPGEPVQTTRAVLLK